MPPREPGLESKTVETGWPETDKRLNYASNLEQKFSRSISKCNLAAYRYIRYTIIFPSNEHILKPVRSKKCNLSSSNGDASHVCCIGVTIYNI